MHYNWGVAPSHHCDQQLISLHILVCELQLGSAPHLWQATAFIFCTCFYDNYNWGVASPPTSGEQQLSSLCTCCYVIRDWEVPPPISGKQHLSSLWTCHVSYHWGVASHLLTCDRVHYEPDCLRYFYRRYS